MDQTATQSRRLSMDEWRDLDDSSFLDAVLERARIAQTERTYSWEEVRDTARQAASKQSSNATLI